MRCLPLAPRAVFLLGASVLATVLGGCATSDARRDIMRENERLYRGIGARDLATLSLIVSDDFRFEAADGQKGDRKAWLDGVAAIPGTIESISNENLSLRAEGDHFVLCGVQRAAVVVEGKRILDKATFCDRWERRDGRWLVTFAGPGR